MCVYENYCRQKKRELKNKTRILKIEKESAFLEIEIKKSKTKKKKKAGGGEKETFPKTRTVVSMNIFSEL